MKKRGLLNEGGRFLVVGGLNTGFTFALYQLLLIWFSSAAAYTLSWSAGLIFVTIMYPKRVFQGGKLTLKNGLLNAGWYFVVFGAGVASLQWLISLGMHERIAIFAVIAFTTLLNFAGARWIFKRDAAA